MLGDHLPHQDESLAVGIALAPILCFPEDQPAELPLDIGTANRVVHPAVLHHIETQQRALVADVRVWTLDHGPNFLWLPAAEAAF